MSASEIEAYVRNRGAFYGTSSAIKETVVKFVDLGCRSFMVCCDAAPQMASLARLASLCPQA